MCETNNEMLLIASIAATSPQIAEAETASLLAFNSLPIEILLKIIDLLPAKSILSLRIVSKRFKDLVDLYATRVWRKLNYRLDLDKLAKSNTLTSGLNSFENFLNRVASINVIDVKCENVLARDKKIELNLRNRKNRGGALRTDRLVFLLHDFKLATFLCI